MSIASLRHTFAVATVALGLGLAAPAGRADDLDIYTDPTPLPAQAPLTALALDLNLTNPGNTVCNNVLTSTEANCVEIQGKVSLGDLITLLGLPANIIGPLDPLTLLSDLSSAVRNALAAPISLLVSLSLNEQQVQILGIQQIIAALADSRLSIILNHNDTAANGAACSFADTSSMPGERQDTPGCSNGAYLFTGLTDLSDPLQLAALVTRMVTALSSDIVTIDPTAQNPVAINLPRAYAADHPYQAKEIYAELAKYLRGDAIFNGHLGVFDYGDDNVNDNLNTSFPLLSWDPTAEQVGNRNYQSGLAAFPQACNINLVHVQATNAAAQDDSDDALKQLFPDADSDGNGTLTLPELVASAQGDGFVFGNDDRRRINSRFVVQENLFTGGDLSDLDRIGALGGNVNTYTNVLGLLGRGQSIAGSLIEPLSVDTTLASLTLAASRTSSTGRLDAAYLPVFRADPDQKPAWPGNLKRLKLRPKPAPNPGQLFDVVDARDDSNQPAVPALNSEGRIRSNALTVWTDATKLGTGMSNDGSVADLGGAGQRIPGFQFGGGGDPGRSNSESGKRKLYYDSLRGPDNTLCGEMANPSVDCGKLNPDDSGVRSELLAATGATAYTSPFQVCASSCNLTAGLCGSLCTTQAVACNLLCLPGLLGNACRSNCDSQQASCNTDCTNALNSCLVSCGPGSSNRTADTITRELLLHARGFNVGTKAAPLGNGTSDAPTNSGVASRAWMMGAVLHSRPVAINYGKRNGSTDDVRVVFGSADGILHLVDDATGAENWGFMPQAVMGSIATLRENQSGAALPYGVDGAPLVLIRDKAPTTGPNAGVRGVIGDVLSVEDNPLTPQDETVEGDRVLLFFGLRRGGAAYYALDITDPDAPKLQWKLTTAGLHRAGQATVDAGSAAQFAALGLAFSTPQVARIRLDDSGATETPNTDVAARTVLIFGGGYHGGRNGAGVKIGKDFNNSRNLAPLLQVGLDDGGPSTTDRGNALFMIDAATGQLIWRAVRSATAAASYNAGTLSYAHPMLVDSIPSDVTAVDTDNDGFTDRLYVGDTGGRLWRADFASTLRSAWTMTPLASVGRHNRDGLIPAATVAEDRRIFFAPDYVPIRDSVTRRGLDLILFGTGDREDPLNLVTQNSFYALRDTDLVSGKSAGEVVVSESSTALAKHSDFTDVTTTASSSLQDISSLTTGYRFQFSRSGEKHFSSPVTLGGTSTFTSYVPPDPSMPGSRICTPSEGVSRLYSIVVRNSRFTAVNGQSAGRDVPLATGLPGEVNALAGTQQAAGGQVYAVPAQDFYRASWRERLGETQK